MSQWGRNRLTHFTPTASGRCLPEAVFLVDLETCVPVPRVFICRSPAVFIPPVTELVEHLHEGMTPVCQRVFHLGRDLRIDRPDDQIVRLELLQVLAERLVRDLLQIALHLIKTDGLVLHQTIENDRLVLAGDQGQGIAVSCRIEISVFNSLLCHMLTSG